jgi:hypothetical protein
MIYVEKTRSPAFQPKLGKSKAIWLLVAAMAMFALGSSVYYYKSTTSGGFNCPAPQCRIIWVGGIQQCVYTANPGRACP